MTEDLNTSELDKEQQSLEMLKSSNATLAEAKSSARSQRKKSKNTINKSKSYTQLDAFVYKKPKISQCEITIDPMEDTIELPSVPIKLIESQQEPGNTPIPTETIENIIDCAKNTNDESPNVITDNEIPSAINIAVNNSVEPILQEKVQIPLNPFFKKLTKRKKSDVSEVSTPSIQDSSKNDECVSVNNLGTQSNNIRKTKRSRKPPNDKLVNLVHSTTIHTDEVSNSIVNVKTKTKAIAVVSPLITTSGSKKSRKLKPIKPIFSESIDIFKEHNSTEVSTSKGENKIDQINDTTEPQSQLLEHQTESIQDIAETTPAINEKIEHIVESTNIAIGSTASQNIVIDIEEANNDDKNITFTESVEPNVQENKIPLNPFFTKLTKRKKSEHIVESNNSTAMTASSIEDSITNDKSTELCNVKSKRTKKAKRSKKLQTDTIKVDEVSSTSTINAKSDTENNDVTMITSPLTATSGPAHSINSKAIDTSVICEDHSSVEVSSSDIIIVEENTSRVDGTDTKDEEVCILTEVSVETPTVNNGRRRSGRVSKPIQKELFPPLDILKDQNIFIDLTKTKTRTRNELQCEPGPSNVMISGLNLTESELKEQYEIERLISKRNQSQSEIDDDYNPTFDTNTESNKRSKKVHGFFLNSKERQQQFAIEQSIKYQQEIEESNKLMAALSKGKSTNPFFNKSMRQVNTVSEKGPPIVFYDALLPKKDWLHVGFKGKCEVILPSITEQIWLPKVICPYFETVKPMQFNLTSTPPNNSSYVFKMEEKASVFENLVAIYGYDELCENHCTADLFIDYEENGHRINKDHMLWTDSCRPLTADTVVGKMNREAASEIVTWLDEWSYNFDAFVEATRIRKQKKKMNANFIDDDEYDFYQEEQDTNANPVLIVIGPPGTGKTMLVHLIAEEKGYEVLEVNTSRKRNGKAIIDILNDAATSHSVKRKKTVLSGLSETDPAKPMGKPLILIDDVDVLFEDDKGFWSALLSVIASTKSPIVLTCTNNPLSHNNPSILTGLQDLMVLSRVIRTVCPSEDELAMYINTICCKNGYQLEKDILDTLITSNIRQSLNRVQFLCSTSPLNPTQDHSVSITCKRQEKVIEETLEEISRKLCQYSDFEILTMDSQEPEHNSDELMLHAPLIQKPNQELQTFYNFNLSHYLPTHKPIDIVNQYTARNEIYDAISIDYFHLLAYRARDTELLPYLCTIAHLDQPRYLSHDIQLSSRRLTRNSTTKPQKHLRMVEDEYHEILARRWFD